MQLGIQAPQAKKIKQEEKEMMMLVEQKKMYKEVTIFFERVMDTSKYCKLLWNKSLLDLLGDVHPSQISLGKGRGLQSLFYA